MPLNIRFRHSALLLALLASSGLRAEIMVEDRPLSSAAVKPVAVAKPTPLEAPAPAATSSAKAEDSSGWESYNQMQQLQEELGRLRGTVEEQAHQIEKLQTDLRTRYTDLDLRFNALQEQIKQAAPVAAVAAGDAVAPSATIEEEKKAYLAAYEVFRAGGPDKAIPPMLAFVKRYPNSTFTPGAYYWLGEFYLNASTPDQASAQKHFETVLSKYPDHAKAPASLYKLGSILDLQGKPQDAKKKMQDLLTKYPKSPEAGLADSYLKALQAAEAQAAKPAKPAATPAAKKAPAQKT
ncbi:MAG: tol-pal system protein YbgF [Moraxellaceae bacterium]